MKSTTIAKKLIGLCFTFFLFSSTVDLNARQPYEAVITVDSARATVTAPNLVDLKRDLSTSEIQELIPFYTPTSAVSFDIDLRGIDAFTSFAANSTTLVVNIPQANFSGTFTGESREDSLILFKEFIKDAGNQHRLLKAYARYSPIDPIAGNPNSLMAQMGQADYLIGRLSPLSGCESCWCAQPIVNQVQIGSYLGRSFAGGFDTTSVTMPLRYSYSWDLNHAFIIDAPLTYLRNGGASSLVGSVGVGFRLPIWDCWSLTPIVRMGSGGSLDLCTSAAFISTGLTSNFDYKVSNFVFSLTNYASYIASTNLWLSGVNFNYHLHNYILKNGLSLTTCDGWCLCGRNINLSLSFIDSYFGRERLYIRHYDEVGFSLITEYLNPYLEYDNLSVGFAFRFGQHHYKGYFLNLAYQF